MARERDVQDGVEAGDETVKEIALVRLLTRCGAAAVLLSATQAITAAQGQFNVVEKTIPELQEAMHEVRRYVHQTSSPGIQFETWKGDDGKWYARRPRESGR